MQTIHKADGFEGQKILVLPETILKDVSHHPLIKPLHVTDIGFFPSARFHYRERPEGCEATIFIYCVEGEGWVRFEGEKKIPVLANTLLIIPAHTPHTYGATEANPWSIYWLHLKGEAVKDFVESFFLSASSVYIPPKETMKILSLFDQCYETLLYKGYSWRYHLYTSQMMRHLLGSIAILPDETPHGERKSEYVEHAMQYMFQHVESSLTLEELADYVHLSKPHFIHIFKNINNCTPMEYYMHLKIQRACQYLDLTDYSIKEVSRNVGIQDPYYFSRVFHKIMGQSPTEYRKIKKG